MHDDSREVLEQEALHLHEAARIVSKRFTTGKHDQTIEQLRKAASELLSRARHPSRNFHQASP